MRRGISLFVALAIVGCASEDVPSEKLAGSPSPGGNVTGSWTVAWGTMVGTNTYLDTLPDSSTLTRTVRDTCAATGALTLTQHTPVAYVTGPYTVHRTCRSHFVTSKGLDSLFIGVVTDTLVDSVRNANMGSGQFAFTLDKPGRQVQLGLISGTTMNGPVRWSITMKTRPTKARGTVSGLFAATSP
jgi:hypothetical protein